jgi:DNA-binding transcriptional LysR family regulator
VLGAFRAAHPGVAVSLVVQDTQSICERVLEGELEVGIVGAARPHRGLEFAPFLRDELVVIALPSHPLAGRTSITLEELAAEPLLMQQTGSGVRAVLEAAFRSAGIRSQDLKIEMELGLQQSVKAAVLAGLGVTVISRLTVASEVAEGQLAAISIEGHELVRDFSTVRASGRTPTRLTTAFLEFAGAELATNP